MLLITVVQLYYRKNSLTNPRLLGKITYGFKCEYASASTRLTVKLIYNRSYGVIISKLWEQCGKNIILDFSLLHIGSTNEQILMDPC